MSWYLAPSHRAAAAAAAAGAEATGGRASGCTSTLLLLCSQRGGRRLVRHAAAAAGTRERATEAGAHTLQPSRLLQEQGGETQAGSAEACSTNAHIAAAVAAAAEERLPPACCLNSRKPTRPPTCSGPRAPKLASDCAEGVKAKGSCGLQLVG